jgi:hypothetical protein
MGEENYAEHPSENSCCAVVVRGRQFANHRVLSGQARFARNSMSQSKMMYPYIRILYVEVNGN